MSKREMGKNEKMLKEDILAGFDPGDLDEEFDEENFDEEAFRAEEEELRRMIERIREDYPDFWREEPSIPLTCNAAKLYEQKKKDRAKKRRRVIAGFCAGVFVFGSAFAVFLNSDTAHAMKFALEKKYYESKGLISATNPENVNVNNTISVTITDESKIVDYIFLWDGLMIPKYMPQDYKFEKLHLEKQVSGKAFCGYIYTNINTSLNVTMRTVEEKSNDIVWLTSDDVRNGTCNYVLWDDPATGTNGIDGIINDVIVTICAPLTHDELISIINGLE